MYIIQHCFICCNSESTVSEDAGSEPRTVETLALTARCSNHLARYNPHSTLSIVLLSNVRVFSGIFYQELWIRCSRVVRASSDTVESERLHCKKELAIFPSPAGMSLTKLSLGGKKLNYSRPGRVWSVTSRLGTGKRLTLFYNVQMKQCGSLEVMKMKGLKGQKWVYD